jgi:hypothetical protein
MRENSMSIVLLDTMQQKIRFPEINEELKVSRSEKALYALILVESITGGMNLNAPTLAKQLPLHQKKMDKLFTKYKKIYHYFGGEIDQTPDILDYTIRNPKLAKIKKNLMSLSNKLSNIDDYMIQRTQEGLYRINIDSSMIYCSGNDPTPWMQSDRWRDILSM